MHMGFRVVQFYFPLHDATYHIKVYVAKIVWAVLYMTPYHTPACAHLQLLHVECHWKTHAQKINEMCNGLYAFFYMMSRSRHQKIMCINETMHASNVNSSMANDIVRLGQCWKFCDSCLMEVLHSSNVNSFGEVLFINFAPHKDDFSPFQLCCSS